MVRGFEVIMEDTETEIDATNGTGIRKDSRLDGV